jgi:hypothetical protein
MKSLKVINNKYKTKYDFLILTFNMKIEYKSLLQKKIQYIIETYYPSESIFINWKKYKIKIFHKMQKEDVDKLINILNDTNFSKEIIEQQSNRIFRKFFTEVKQDHKLQEKFVYHIQIIFEKYYYHNKYKKKYRNNYDILAISHLTVFNFIDNFINKKIDIKYNKNMLKITSILSKKLEDYYENEYQFDWKSNLVQCLTEEYVNKQKKVKYMKKLDVKVAIRVGIEYFLDKGYEKFKRE